MDKVENKNKPDPMAFARQEAIIRRMDEVKRDSVKIGLLEEILSQLRDIKTLLINDRNEKIAQVQGARKLPEELDQNNNGGN